MTHFFRLFGFAVLLVGVPTWANAADPAPDRSIRTERTLKFPRTREPVLGGSKEEIVVQVWIPGGVKALRGGICNPFSKIEDVSKHWQAVCRLWQFAYIQVDFDAVKKEEFPWLADALRELAKTSGHPELEHLPLAFTGMSRGGGMSMQLAELLPARTLASVPVCLEVGPTTAASRTIPVITVFGEKDGQQMEKLLTKLSLERKENAQWGLAVQWNRKHEFGQANNLTFPFFDDVFAKRLPKQPQAGAIPLRKFEVEDGWLADPATWGKDGQWPRIASWKDYLGEKGQAFWFPTERVAAVWRYFVAGTKDVTLASPAGLGDGQAFATHAASKPIAVKANVAAALKPERVELWDAEKKLATKLAAPWEFEVTLKPGIHSLAAVVVQSGAIPRSSRPHTIVVVE